METKNLDQFFGPETRDKINKLIKDWFYSKTGTSIMHDPSIISLINEIESLVKHNDSYEKTNLKQH